MQSVEMSIADERIHRVCRADHLSKPAHFSKIGDTHFNDRSLVFGLDAKYRQRYAEFVVKVFVCFQNAKSLRENCRYHFLCRRFSDRTRDTDDRNTEHFSVRLGKARHRFGRAVNNN